MGFDLTNDNGDYLRFSPSGWALALNVAESYGWCPAGTTLPPESEINGSAWTGEYATNDGQLVSAADAAALAGACARAIASEDYSARTAAIFQEITGLVRRAFDGEAPPRAPFGEAEIAGFRIRLEALIAFCGGGGFQDRLRSAIA